MVTNFGNPQVKEEDKNWTKGEKYVTIILKNSRRK